ncbi:ATP-dependent RNA helicase (DEAD-box protein) [Escherichia coli]|nr:ATP-dependent RNA helicase (DEAD-box protein) [Escherichia coli]
MAEFETTFADLGLKAPILEALNDLGYEKPSPIQAECIPHLLNGTATFWVWPRRGAEKLQHSLYLCCRILILS